MTIQMVCIRAIGNYLKVIIIARRIIMDDNDIDLMIILSMLKLRFETKQKLTIDNIHAKTNELSNSLLNGKAITDSIKRLRFQGHIKENLDILLLRSGIVFTILKSFKLVMKLMKPWA